MNGLERRIDHEGVELKRQIFCRRVVYVNIESIPKLAWTKSAATLGLDLTAELKLTQGATGKFTVDVMRAVQLYGELLRSQGAPVAWLGAVTRSLRSLLQTPGAENALNDPAAAAVALGSTVVSGGRMSGAATRHSSFNAAVQPSQGGSGRGLRFTQPSGSGSGNRVDVDPYGLSWDPATAPEDVFDPGEMSGRLPQLPDPARPRLELSDLRLEEFLAALSRGVVLLPRIRSSGEIDLIPFNVVAQRTPSLFLVETYMLAFTPSDYGPGRPVATFTLLPGESTHIRLVSWRVRAPKWGSNVIDSCDSASTGRFDEALGLRVTDDTTRTLEAYLGDLLTQAGHGGVLHVHGGGAADMPLRFHAGREDYVRQVQRTLDEHVAMSNAYRTAWVTSAADRRPETAQSEVRAIGNANMRRTLSFVFRELNQAYKVGIFLTDMRVGFSNGRLLSWRESSLPRLGPFLGGLLQSGNDDVAAALLKLAGTTIDGKDVGKRFLEQADISADATDWKTQSAVPNGQGEYAAPTATTHYRPQLTDAELKEHRVVLCTDSIIAEPMLGKIDALDEYALNLQKTDIAEREAAVAQTKILNDTLTAINDPEKRSRAYADALRPDGSVKLEIDQAKP